jgi:hypothetical protein
MFYSYATNTRPSTLFDLLVYSLSIIFCSPRAEEEDDTGVVLFNIGVDTGGILNFNILFDFFLGLGAEETISYFF